MKIFKNFIGIMMFVLVVSLFVSSIASAQGRPPGAGQGSAAGGGGILVASD